MIVNRIFKSYCVIETGSMIIDPFLVYIFSRSSKAGLHLPFWLSAAGRDRRTPDAWLCCTSWCFSDSSSSGMGVAAVVAARVEAEGEAPRRNSGQNAPSASKLRVSVRCKPLGPSTARTTHGSQSVCCTSPSPDLFCAPSHRLFPRCSDSVDQTAPHQQWRGP